MAERSRWRSVLRVPLAAIAIYLALSAAHALGDRALLDRAHPSQAGWLLAKVALPCAITLVALGVAWAAGLGRRELGLCGAPGRMWTVALVAGVAPVLVVAWHGATQGFGPLLGLHAAKLTRCASARGTSCSSCGRR